MSKKKYTSPQMVSVFLNLDENYMGGPDIISSPGLDGTGSGGNTSESGDGGDEFEGDTKVLHTNFNIWDEEW